MVVCLFVAYIFVSFYCIDKLQETPFFLPDSRQIMEAGAATFFLLEIREGRQKMLTFPVSESQQSNELDLLQ